MCVTICGRFLPDEGAVAGYGNRIRVKYTAKWGVQIAGMIFQTRSKVQGFGTTGISKFKDKGDNTEMALRTIRTEGDSVLEKICRPVEKIDKRTKDLVGDMLETMYDACGVGLAAPQVGILKRIVVIDIGDGPIILINPEILMTSGEQTGEEGCLSVPGMSGQVTRPNYVKVKALDMDMNEQIYEGEGLLARAFCHELDHLDGKMYTRLVEGELHHVSYDNEEEEE